MVAHRFSAGFTLIELMIAVAIAAIISAVAVPQYSQYVTRSKISEATSNLSDLRTDVEKWFQTNRTYTGFPCTAPAQSRYFTYSCTLNASSYVIAANGVNGQGMGGFRYTINETNARVTTALPSGWSGTGASCWVTGRSGLC